MSRQEKVGRKTAAKKLKVSIRTVDRYIKQGKLSTFKVDNRIYLYLNEIEGLIIQKNSNVVVDKKTPLSTVDSVDRVVDTQVDTSIDTVDIIDQKAHKKENSSVYQKLYDEQRVEVIQNQKKLEFANYRIGLLEGELKSSIPISEFNHFKALKKDEKLTLDTQVNSQKKHINNLQKELKNTNLKKQIIFYVLLLLASLQPIWLYISLAN